MSLYQGIGLAPTTTLTSLKISLEYELVAEVAELADALRSGRSDHLVMWVQIPPSALREIKYYKNI